MTVAPASIAAGALWAVCPLTRCLPGAGVPIALGARNDSRAPWDMRNGGRCPRIDFHWRAGHAPVLLTSNPRPLPAPLPPGETAWFTETVPAPAIPGRYTLTIGYRVNSLFGADFSPLTRTLHFHVHVADAPDRVLRAALEAEQRQATWAAAAAAHDARCRLQEPLLAAWAARQPAPQGDFRLLVAPGHRAHPLAHAFVQAAFDQNPDAIAAYGDWDVIEPDGSRHSPRLSRPASLLESRETPCFGPLVAVRGAALALCEAMETASPAWSHALELKLLEQDPGARLLCHVPAFLSHAEGAPAAVQGDGLASGVREHLRRRQCSADVTPVPGLPAVHVRYALPAKAPRVTVIIPTRDRPDLIQPCLAGLVARTDYPDLDILVVDHQTVEPQARRLLDALAAAGRIRLLPYVGPFNWADMNNRAVAATDAEFICLLNNDTEVMHEGWLRELVGLAVQPGVGVAGATLWFADGTLQHGGMRSDGLVTPIPIEKGAQRSQWRSGWGAAVRSVCAVAAACAVMRRQVYLDAGGMDASELPVALNDIDFCLRVRTRLGLQVLCTPHAELWHYESKTRGRPEKGEELERIARSRAVFRERWPSEVAQDPTFGPAFAPAPVLQPWPVPRAPR